MNVPHLPRSFFFSLIFVFPFLLISSSVLLYPLLFRTFCAFNDVHQPRLPFAHQATEILFCPALSMPWVFNITFYLLTRMSRDMFETYAVHKRRHMQKEIYMAHTYNATRILEFISKRVRLLTFKRTLYFHQLE